MQAASWDGGILLAGGLNVRQGMLTATAGLRMQAASWELMSGSGING